MAVAQQQQQPLLPLNWCVIYSSVSHHHMRRQSLESYIMLSAAVVRNYSLSQFRARPGRDLRASCDVFK